MRRFFDRLPITFTAQALLYPLFLFAALVFAQLLRRSVTHMLFIFAALLPAATLVWLLAARLCIRVTFRVSEATTKKHAPIHFFACISNKSPLPFAFVNAVLELPDENGADSVPCEHVLALMPFSSCKIERTAGFAYRGRYRTGVKCLYIYDLFHAVRLRIPVKCGSEILVLPRKLQLTGTVSHRSGDADGAHVLGSPIGLGSETADIRQYTPGDNVHRIHWKLSSKSEELIVRDTAQVEGTDVAVLCDLERHSKNANRPSRLPLPKTRDIIDIAHGDMVIEAAAALTLRELAAGNTVLLAYIENGAPTSFVIRSVTELDAVFHRFAAAELSELCDQLATLAAMPAVTSGAMPILVTPRLDAAAAAEYMSLIDVSLCGGASELVLCADDSLFVPDSDHERERRECVLSLHAAGCTVTDAAKLLKI